MTQNGCGLVVIVFAAANAAAESPGSRSPVEVTAGVHVRSIADIFAEDGALDGRGPGASVRIGLQRLNWLQLQLDWNYVREDDVRDQFDRMFDEHAHQFLIGPAFVAHLGSRVSASVGSGLALSYFNGGDAPQLKKGVWGAVRIDVDVVRITESHALAVVLDGSVVTGDPNGVAASIGIAYHLR